jgi:starvation-inducible outer membrane lipoprotein|tara:strand:- start:54 stop:335 length:282 start_codon:yes stop_codon:yes gene_type:complete
MSKDMERKIILIMLLYLVFLGLSGCMTTPKANTKNTEQANISVYNGTISKMLGCIFAPSECEKFKKQESQEDLQDEITEEMMEMDEDISKDNK